MINIEKPKNKKEAKKMIKELRKEVIELRRQAVSKEINHKYTPPVYRLKKRGESHEEEE